MESSIITGERSLHDRLGIRNTMPLTQGILSGAELALRHNVSSATATLHCLLLLNTKDGAQSMLNFMVLS